MSRKNIICLSVKKRTLYTFSLISIFCMTIYQYIWVDGWWRCSISGLITFLKLTRWRPEGCICLFCFLWTGFIMPTVRLNTWNFGRQLFADLIGLQYEIDKKMTLEVPLFKEGYHRNEGKVQQVLGKLWVSEQDINVDPRCKGLERKKTRSVAVQSITWELKRMMKIY